MDFSYSKKTQELIERMQGFLDDSVYPAEKQYRLEVEASEDHIINTLPPSPPSRRRPNPLSVEPLSSLEAKPSCRTSRCTTRRTDRKEHRSRSVWPRTGSPDTGNMEILSLFGTDPEEQWLAPLLTGDIRSCFAMTEPGVASSDASNIETALGEGDKYVVTGRKWWTSRSASAAVQVRHRLGPFQSGRGSSRTPKHGDRSARFAWRATGPFAESIRVQRCGQSRRGGVR